MYKISEEVIYGLKNGSRDALDEVFNAYSSKIYYLALKYTKNVDDANDSVQEIFMKVFKNIKSFNGSKADFGTWLYRIADNYLIDRMRLKKIHSSYVVHDDEYVEDLGRESDTITKIQLSQIEKLVGEENYQILVLKIGFEMTFKDIASRLKQSDSMIKRKYYQAYKMAKDFYKGGKVK